MKKSPWVFIAAFALFTHVAANTAWAADALVYQGPGSCDEGCSEAAALVAREAGLRPVFVGPSEKDFSVFKKAVVWIQPGGTSLTAAQNMSADLKDTIRKFVGAGGAYVGFCAGGFLATGKIGDLSDDGLGLIGGRSQLYEKAQTDAAIVTLNWEGKTRYVYWEGGPAFYPSASVEPSAAAVETVATYSDNTAAAIRSTYGAGRVFVAGTHPEAPQWWRKYFRLRDPDGLDYDLAVGMIRWATRTEHHHSS